MFLFRTQFLCGSHSGHLPPIRYYGQARPCFHLFLHTHYLARIDTFKVTYVIQVGLAFIP
jgi:hypothetical protein